MKRLVTNPIFASIIIVALIIPIAGNILSGIAWADTPTTAVTTTATAAPTDVAVVETAPAVEEPVISDPVVDPVVETAPADVAPTTPVVDPVVVETPAPVVTPVDSTATAPAKAVEVSAPAVISTVSAAATAYCGVVAFSTPAYVEISSGESVRIAGSFSDPDGGYLFATTSWGGGDGVANDFDFDVTPPSTPGTYTVSFAEYEAVGCPSYTVTIVVLADVPVGPPTDPVTPPVTGSGTVAPGPVQDTAPLVEPKPDDTASQVSYSVLPETGINLASILMCMLTLSIIGVAMMYSRRFVGNKH